MCAAPYLRRPDPASMTNTLYFGDNLDVLRRHVPDEAVDLVYLDPPFKSDQDYNVLFRTHDGSRAPAQIKAFEDTWRWDQAAARAFEEVVTGEGFPAVHVRLSQTMQAFRRMLGENDLLCSMARASRCRRCSSRVPRSGRPPAPAAPADPPKATSVCEGTRGRPSPGYEQHAGAGGLRSEIAG